MTDYLLWLDLETTGDPDIQYPLEIAAVITDTNFSPVGNPFQALIEVPKIYDLSRVVPPDVVYQMHEDSGLWYDLEDPTKVKYTITKADIQLVRWIGDTIELEPITLAGSGVSHFDSRLLKKYFPIVWNNLKGFDHHTKPTLDMGVIRRYLKFANVGLELPTADETRAHRALYDIQHAIHQARWLKERLNTLMHTGF